LPDYRSYRERDAGYSSDEEFIPQIDMQVSAHFPEEYIPDIHQRLEMYKRLMSSKDYSELRIRRRNSRPLRETAAGSPEHRAAGRIKTPGRTTAHPANPGRRRSVRQSALR
jgi:hypothetical protein